MSEIRVASRYAKSLLDLAQEQGKLAVVEQDVRLFANTLTENRELRLLLRNPIVKSDKKLTVLEKLFTGKMNDLTLRFFILVGQKSREEVLEQVAIEFMNQYRTFHGIQQAHVTTASPLTEEQRREFTRLATEQTGKQQIELIEKVDPAIIGGFVLRLGDRQIDDSVASRLQRLRTTFVDQSYVSKL